MILDLANLLQVGFDLRNRLELKISPSKIKDSGRQQYTERDPKPIFESRSVYIRKCNVNKILHVMARITHSFSLP